MPTVTRKDSVSVWGPQREFWVFNPGPRLDICLDEGIYDFVYDQRTYDFKSNMGISPKKHLQQLGQNFPWRVMLIDYHRGLALLHTNEIGWGRQAGAFPMWSTLEPIERLHRLLDNYPQPGDTVGWFTGAPYFSYGVEGQEQRILIYNLPQHPVAWENTFRNLMDAKRDHPDIIFHACGQKSIPRTLGVGIDSFDHPVTLQWKDGQPTLLMANGRLLEDKEYRDGHDHEKWSRLIGIQAREIFEQEDRVRKSRRMYRYNLRSLKWAFANYDQVWSGRISDESQVSIDDPDSSWVSLDIKYRPRSSDINDKWLCDLCSISHRCPYFKPGAICIVDDTEAANLAKNFKSRNAQDILDGLGVLVGAQTERTHQAMKAEKRHNDEFPENPKFSSEVSRMLAATFDQGVTLARLIDPHMGVAAGRGGSRRVIESHVAGQVAGATPQELAAGMMKELERAGKDITQLTAEEAQDFLARIVPAGTMPPHVDEDAPSVEPDGGSNLVVPTPSFRAAPSFDSGIPGTEVFGPDGDDP